MYFPQNFSNVRHSLRRWATRLALCGSLSAIAVSAAVPVEAQEPVPPAPDQPLVVPMPETVLSEDDVEVTLKGPLHEAFARTVTLDAASGPRVNRQPPELIDEVPPDVQPEGENVIWIPGYWSWDDSTNDFLWISGLWRDMPPGRRWVPGYWAQEDDAWQWYAGFWADAEQESVQYLPQPPESLDLGPTSPAPSDNYFWIPGCWEYNGLAYAWRPGYWAPFVNDWVWVPSSYSVTPRGYVYCDGYWDYRLSRRGSIFAPLRFRRYGHYHYRPSYVLNYSSLLLHLFVDSRTGCYLYGDWYGYGAATPWYVSNRRHRHYDPILTYNRWTYGSGYTTRLAGWTTWFRSHSDYRPRHSVRDQDAFASRHRNQSWLNQAVIGTSLSRALSDGDRHGHRFQRVDESSRRRTAEWSRGIAQLRTDRERTETGRGRADGHRGSGSAGITNGDRDGREHGRGTGERGQASLDRGRAFDRGHGVDREHGELKLPQLSPELRSRSSRGASGLPSFGSRSQAGSTSRDGDRSTNRFGQFGQSGSRFGDTSGRPGSSSRRPESTFGRSADEIGRRGEAVGRSDQQGNRTGSLSRQMIRPDRGPSSTSTSPQIQLQPRGNQGSVGSSSSSRSRSELFNGFNGNRSSNRGSGSSDSRSRSSSIFRPPAGSSSGSASRSSGSSSRGSLGNALESLRSRRESSSSSRGSASRSSSRPSISTPKSGFSQQRSSSSSGSSSRRSSSSSSRSAISPSSRGSVGKALNQAFDRSRSSSSSRGSSSRGSSSRGSTSKSSRPSTPKSGFSKGRK